MRGADREQELISRPDSPLYLLTSNRGARARGWGARLLAAACACAHSAGSSDGGTDKPQIDLVLLMCLSPAAGVLIHTCCVILFYFIFFIPHFVN